MSTIDSSQLLQDLSKTANQQTNTAGETQTTRLPTIQEGQIQQSAMRILTQLRSDHLHLISSTTKPKMMLIIVTNNIIRWNIDSSCRPSPRRRPLYPNTNDSSSLQEGKAYGKMTPLDLENFDQDEMNLRLLLIFNRVYTTLDLQIPDTLRRALRLLYGARFGQEHESQGLLPHIRGSAWLSSCLNGDKKVSSTDQIITGSKSMDVVAVRRWRCSLSCTNHCSRAFSVSHYELQQNRMRTIFGPFTTLSPTSILFIPVQLWLDYDSEQSDLTSPFKLPNLDTKQPRAISLKQLAPSTRSSRKSQSI